MTDISHLCNFGWYEWVKFRREGSTAAFPYPVEQLGRCLGPAKNKGKILSQRVLTSKGELLPVQTLRKLTPAELDNPAEKKRRDEFDAYILERDGDSRNPPKNWVKRKRKPGDHIQPEDPTFDYEHVEEPNSNIAEDSVYEDDSSDKAHEMPEVDDIVEFDLYIHNEVLLPQNGEYMQAAKVISSARDSKGVPIGSYNVNPALNTKVYDVQFPYGSIQQYAANIMAENLDSQVDEEGFRYLLMDEIVDHKVDESAVRKEDGHTIDKTGRKRKRLTTKGWSFLVQWKDGTQSWLLLKDMKESYPVEVAEYAIAKSIATEPAFDWWVPFTLRKRDRVIMAVNSRVKKRSHKYGVEVPTSVSDAYRLDAINGNNYWGQAIKKEMGNVLIAFDLLEVGDKPPRNLKRLGVHLIFDVKMDLTRKA